MPFSYFFIELIVDHEKKNVKKKPLHPMHFQTQFPRLTTALFKYKIYRERQ